MAVSDERQRIMPTAGDRQNGLVLDYPEAVLLTNPSNPELRGEVEFGHFIHLLPVYIYMCCYAHLRVLLGQS